LHVEEVPGFLPVRLAILASSTVDHLPPAIRVAGLRRGLLIDIHRGTYGQYRQDLLTLGSSLHEFKPKVILFSLTARELLAEIPLAANRLRVDEMIGRWISELRQLWRKARDAFNATIIQQTFINVAAPLFGNYDRLVPSAPTRVVSRLNDQLAEAAAEDGVLLLDAARASERHGIDTWFETVRW